MEEKDISDEELEHLYDKIRAEEPPTDEELLAQIQRLNEPTPDSTKSTMRIPFPHDVRVFVDSTKWTFAKTYAHTWPHEYIVKNAENAKMIVALARHIFEHGVDGRFYAQVRRYHHEGGKAYWSMDDTPETTGLINRCDENQTWEARRALGTLPK